MMGWWRRWRQGEVRTVCRPDWLAAAGPRFADSIMSQQVTDRFHSKQGRSTGRWVLPGPSAPLVVYLKRHTRLSWWRRLLALLVPGGTWTPAAAEWEHLHWSLQRGVPVPEPLAVGEFIGPGLRLESFIVVRELTGMLPLHEAIPLAQQRKTATAFTLWKRELSAEMARLTRRLHDARRFHKDLYLCHFYLPASDCEQEAAATPRGRLHLIDLHRLGHHPLSAARWRRKDLGQLLFSSFGVQGITVRDRIRFLRQYGGDRSLRSSVIAKAAQYVRHNRSS